MNFRRLSFRILHRFCHLFGGLCLLSGTAVANLQEGLPTYGPDILPPGLTQGQWQQVNTQIRAARYQVEPDEAAPQTFHAANPAHGWITTFSPAGATLQPPGAEWHWGLKPVAYGVGDTLRPLEGTPRLSAEENRLFYDWNNLREGYRNDLDGLEQYFILQQRPSKQEGVLRLELQVLGGLAPRIESATGVAFTDDEGADVLTYRNLKVFDAEKRVLPARFEASEQKLAILIDDRGAAYPITIDPLVQQAYLKASNAGENDQFGWSVALDGDILAVGAPYEDSSATGVNGNQTDNSASAAGAVYVFVRNGLVWSQEAYLKASNTGSGDQFGRTVALSGDTLAVGATYEDSGATGVDGNQADNSAGDAGAVYVFVRNGMTWSQQAYLKASNSGEGDYFGQSVSLSGDTLVVGANGEDSAATGVNGNQASNLAGSAGAAYVFVRSGTAWSQEAYLKASNSEAYDYFGQSVAISGDSIVVGAYYEGSSATGVNGDQADNSAREAGAAYVFVRSGSDWSQQAYLKASNTDSGDNFGVSVAFSGDTLVVGAHHEAGTATGVNGNQADNSAANAGAAYVFVRSGALWSQQAYLKASNTEGADIFGSAVSLSGDTLAVGATYEDSNATGVGGNQASNSAVAAGAAYVFVRSGTTWTQQSYLKASNTGANDWFGQVAFSGDTLVVGAFGEGSNATGVNGNQADNSAGDAGAAYVFQIDSAPPWSPSTKPVRRRTR